MGAAGDGWGLRGRSRSATGFPLLQVCVGWEDASSGVWGGGSALGCPLWGAEEAWSWEGEEGRGGVLMGLRLLAFPHLLPLLSPSQRLWAPFRCGSRVRLLAAPRAVVPGGGRCCRPSLRMGGGYNPPCTPSPLPHPLCPPSTPCRPPPAPGAPRTASPLRRALLLHVGGRVLRRPPRPPPPAARDQQRRGCMRARAWRG